MRSVAICGNLPYVLQALFWWELRAQIQFFFLINVMALLHIILPKNGQQYNRLD
jgi:hypothetical protein